MKLTFAYSPCPNDTFMFEPIVSGRIDTEGLRFEIHLADVEVLNKAASEERYDITKLSFNAYTQLTEKYQLLNSGSALGRNCGPLLISKKNLSPEQVISSAIAIPGENTTANFLLSFAYPEASKRTEILFSDIEKRVLNDEFDAGLIIHENRFTYADKGLKKIIDLGEHWEERTGFPIPLGGIVTRRRFTKELKQKIDRVIARSVAYALSHPDSGMEYIKSHAQEMDEEVMKSHIDLYVNDFSADIGDDGKGSIQYLFDHHPATLNGNYQKPLFVEKVRQAEHDHFLSSEYWSARYKNRLTGWDTGKITTPIKEYFDQLTDKSIRILIPGAGKGHEAEYLHRQGFSNVFVCDIAREALENLKKRCPDFPEDNLLAIDFFEIEDKFDLIIEQTFFCAIHPDLRLKYIDKMIELLKPGGKLVGLLFNLVFPFDGPPFGGNIVDYEELFSTKFDLLVMEPSYNSIAPRSGNEAFFIAQKER